MAERDADDAGFGVLDDPDLREGFAGLQAGGLGQHFDRGGRIRGVVVELVNDVEGGGDALGDRMSGLGDFHSEFAERVMATCAAADDLLVPLREVLPRIPSAGMERDDALAGVGEVDEGLLCFWRNRLVGAEDDDVDILQDRCDAVKILGEIHPADGRGESGLVGDAEEFYEVMGRAATDKQDARAVCFFRGLGNGVVV